MFSQNLRRLRTQKQLTQKEIASALGISRVAYTNYELGKRHPSLETAAQIARLLGAPVEQLLDSEAESPSAVPRKTGGPSRRPPKGDAQEEALLRVLFMQAQSLSPQSIEELRDYIELLRIRDEASKGTGKRTKKKPFH